METKKCSKCGEEKPLSEFYRSTKYGYMSRCKNCDKDYNKERQRKGLVKRHRKPYVRVADLTPEQLEKRHAKDKRKYERRKCRKEMTCKNNSIYSDVVDFVSSILNIIRIIDESTPEGKLRRRRRLAKIRREINKDKIRERAKLSYSLNREEILAQSKLRYLENKDKIKESDSYIKGQLIQRGIEPTPDLMEFKRVQLMLKREIKRQIADSHN